MVGGVCCLCRGKVRAHTLSAQKQYRRIPEQFTKQYKQATNSSFMNKDCTVGEKDEAGHKPITFC